MLVVPFVLAEQLDQVCCNVRIKFRVTHDHQVFDLCQRHIVLHRDPVTNKFCP